MANLELQLGHITFVGEVAGNHIHVTVLGIGAPGHRPLLGKLTMAGLEWSSLEMMVELKAISDRQQLADRAEIARLDGLLGRERAEHVQTATTLSQTSELLDHYKQTFVEQGALLTEITTQRDAMKQSLAEHQPVRSVISDWDWRGIVADGCFRPVYEPAIEAAAKALATVEGALEKSRG